MIIGIFCHVISQVSGHSENHSTYKTFQVLGPLLPIFNAHHGRDPRLEADAVRAHDRYLSITSTFFYSFIIVLVMISANFGHVLVYLSNQIWFA